MHPRVQAALELQYEAFALTALGALILYVVLYSLRLAWLAVRP